MTHSTRLKGYALPILLLTVGFFVGVSINHALGDALSSRMSGTVLTWGESSSLPLQDTASQDMARQAAHWQLSMMQWERYQSLVGRGVPLDYEALTPVEVLGIYAQSTDELHQLATLAAKQKEARLARELRFGQAIYEAEKILFQDQQAVKP